MSLSVPSSGPIDALTLATVFGLPGPPYDLSKLKRDGVYVPSDLSTNANIPTTLTNLSFLGFRGSGVQYTITLSNSTNVNLYTLFTASFSFTTTRKYVKFTIPTGVTIGSTSSGTPALDIGQFPTGTTIVIENNGNIYGAGGTAGTGGTVYGAAVGAAGGATNGGTGGDAIKANYLNQTVTITNNGIIYGGGGGGGGGGKGATGANGTNGTLTEERYDANNYSQITNNFNTSVNSQIIVWNGVQVYSANNITDPVTVNGIVYDRGSGFLQSSTNNIYVYRHILTRIEQTTGGIGGAGGNGGTGAVGRGNNNLAAALTGLTGSTGSAGTAGGGGTATAGATGATGGSGGNSGNWGLSGSSGSGTNPGSGGSAGRYLLKGSANVTLTGGTTAGLLA